MDNTLGNFGIVEVQELARDDRDTDCLVLVKAQNKADLVLDVPEVTVRFAIEAFVELDLLLSRRSEVLVGVLLWSVYIVLLGFVVV